MNPVQPGPAAAALATERRGARRWRLAEPAESLAALLAEPAAAQRQVDCDLLIVGSGYGGAVAAARLAGATVAGPDGQPRPACIWLLERGLEQPPGGFVSRLGELPGAVRFSRQDGKPASGHASGLFDLRIGDDVHALVGNGLGGGSLINAGVMERPLDVVWAAGWPAAITPDSLAASYEHAEQMLQCVPLPDEPPPRKLRALEATAKGGNVACQRARVAVTFAAGQQTPALVPMAACTRCGDCITGCNQGAKNTLDTNYLAWARRRGVRMFCGGWVARLQRDADADCWRVDWHYTAPEKRQRDPQPLLLRARNVVLAAGSLGSTEILLRSDPDRRLFSPMLGRRFSTNGDLIVAGFRQINEVNACADEDSDPGPDGGRAVGPTVSGLLRAEVKGHAIPVAIQEFAIPAPLQRLLGEAATSFGVLHGLFDGRRSHPADQGEDDLAVTTASLRHTSVYGLMGDDGAAGRIELVPPRPDQAPGDGAVRIVWNAAESPLWDLFEQQTNWLKAACKNVEGGGPGGTVVPNPTWQPLPAMVRDALGGMRGMALTVHPLGGCAMAGDVAGGVVDADGVVFGRGGGRLPGLAVLDGAIVPRALAINPALTIAALAERAIPGLAEHFGMTRADPQPAVDPPADKALHWLPRREAGAAATAIRIREQMRGRIDLPGGPAWAELAIHLAEIPDLRALLRGNAREVAIADAQLRLYPLADVDAGAGAGRHAPLAVLRLSGSLALLVPAPDDDDLILDTERALVKTLLTTLSTETLMKALMGQGGDPSGIATVLDLTDAANACRRQLVYRLTVDAVAAGDPLGLAAGDELVGTKTLGFTRHGNPWRQLSTLQLALQRQAAPLPLGSLCADLDYMSRHRELLLSVTAQRDQVTAWADLASLALLVLRTVAAGQLLALVPPGDAPERSGERRPGAVDGQQPELHALDADCRLSHYRPARRAAAARPLLLIHGLSASGSTFTHASIPGNLASYMLARGRDVWVLDLRTSAANDLRPGPFSFEQVALGDIPRAVDRILTHSDQQKVDVLAHCIGSAMFCMAVLRHPTLHLSIGHAVLSAVGPVVRMSPLNQLRGFVAGLTEQYLSNEEFDVRPEVVRPPRKAPSGAALALFDALLATLPYPQDEHEAARADALDDGSGRHPQDFRRVRHRADAIVGHSFELDNLADETLLALDALFGWVKTRTLAQVQHLARHGVLTDADGVNRDVADSTLRQRFGFPVLLLHGRRNRVFGWQGGRASYRLLKRVFNEPAGASSAVNGDLHWGEGSPRQLYVLSRYGHQDPLIGRHAQFDVFPVIERFLATSEGVQPPLAEPRDRYFCAPPWVGPTLGWLRQAAGEGEVELSLQVHPGPRNATTLCVLLVPADPRPGGGWSLHTDEVRGFRVGDDTAKQQRERLLSGVLTIGLRPADLPDGRAFVVLTLHCDALDASDEMAFVDPHAPAAGNGLLGGLALVPDARLAVSRFVDPLPDDKRADLLLRLGRHILAACDPGQGEDRPGPVWPLRFAAGSCQFPSGLFDRPVAGAAFRALLDRIDRAPQSAPAFLLLLGDQVYLDAATVAFGASTVDARTIARQGYELAWRLPAFRALGARLPVYTMLDDHEIANDWLPPAAGARLNEDERVRLLAFCRHQAALNPRRLGASPSFSYRFAPGGHPFFVLDTRSRREPRRIDAAQSWRDASIVAPADMAALLDWLHEQAAAPVKFIVSPSVVLPLPADFDAGAPRLDWDGWAGYPASLAALLGTIRDERIAGVVLIGGDEHLSLCGRLDFDNGVAVHLVLASGLHAPFPFANARPEGLWLDGARWLEIGGRELAATMHTDHCLVGANQVLIEVLPAAAGQPPQLQVALCPARGEPLLATYPLAGNAMPA